MSRRSVSLMLVIFGCSTGVIRAQAASGPQEGSEVGPLPAFAATGDVAGQVVDFAANPGDRPRVYLFIQAAHWNRPMARFVRTLDQELARGIAGADEAEAVAAWLTDDVDRAREYLPVAQQSLRLERTVLAVFEGDRFGPRDWSIDGEAHLTAVVVRGGKVRQSAGFTGPNETDVPAVVQALQAPAS